MPKFKMDVIVDLSTAQTARLADGGSGSATQFTLTENGKFVKLIGDSQYGLCAVGDRIEGVINVANDIPQAEGFNLGSVVGTQGGRFRVLLDGLQATPGTGTVAVGDYVVAGTVTARGTALPNRPRVCRATAQPGVAVVAADNLIASINAALATVAAAQANGNRGWRVVALISGTGAVGQTALIERV